MWGIIGAFYVVKVSTLALMTICRVRDGVFGDLTTTHNTPQIHNQQTAIEQQQYHTNNTKLQENN